MESASKNRIMIVDDEARMRRSLEILLSGEGYQVATAANFYEALSKLDEYVDLVITDLTMPGKSGIDLLKEIKQKLPEVQVIMVTAYSTVKSAIETMKEGAFEYIVKPFESDELLIAVDRALKIRSLTRENIDLKREIRAMTRYGEIVGSSKKMRDVYYLIERAAETDSTVLITGESGTGKELVARAIHEKSSRARKSFLAINCMAMTETLLESELFGYERGAFTGAIKQKEGKFKAADEGTIFLDEIGEMQPSIQVKLLRVLQERAFERVGGNIPIHVDVRIIAATNRDLVKAIDENSFREDLFYRLNVITIDMPVLRERREDIPLLIDHFLDKKAEHLKMDRKALSAEVKEFLLSYDYPGNVRELENIIERAYAISREKVIYLRDLPFSHLDKRGMPAHSISLPIKNGFSLLEEVTKRMEMDLIKRAVDEYRDVSNEELAKLLGTSRRILELRMKEYGIGKRYYES